MRQTEDLVWNAITESAKRRFDYDAFKQLLNAPGDERIAEYLLFQMIAGYAEELPREDILAKICGDLDLFGYSVSEDVLGDVLSENQEYLAVEVGAAKEALSGFSRGDKADDLLVQAHRRLAAK